MRRPALRHRGQDVEQQGGRVGFGGGFCAVGDVNEPGAVQRQGQCTFDVRLLGQQHPFDVGVLDDGNLGSRQVFVAYLGPGGARAHTPATSGSRCNPALRHPAPHRAGPRSSCGTCRTVPGAARPPGSRPHLPGRRAVATFAEVQHGVDDAAKTHLVVHPGQHDVVALADRPVGADQELGHHEQRNPFGPRGSAGDLGQHQMHDVLGELMIAAGDPHLRAE